MGSAVKSGDLSAISLTQNDISRAKESKVFDSKIKKETEWWEAATYAHQPIDWSNRTQQKVCYFM